jgi:hypothetical protein
MMRLSCGCIAALVLLTAKAAAQPTPTLTFGFDAPGELNLFTVLGQDVEHTSGGVTGGAVRIDSPFPYPASSLVYNQRSLSYANPGDEIATSIMFHYDQLVGLSNGGGVGSALASLQLLSDLNFDSPSKWISIDVSASQFSPTGPISFEVNVLRHQNGTGAGQHSPISPLVDDHWYKLSALFSYGSAATNGVEVTLADYGPDGGTFMGNAFQTSLDLASIVPALKDSTVWAGFAMQFPQGHGNDRSDLFTIAPMIPEPATTTLAAMAACFLGLRRRRAA